MKKLGFGCMRLPLTGGDFETIDKEALCRMTDHFIEKVVQYFGTAWFYHNGQSEAAIKECTDGRRTVVPLPLPWGLLTL